MAGMRSTSPRVMSATATPGKLGRLTILAPGHGTPHHYSPRGPWVALDAPRRPSVHLGFTVPSSSDSALRGVAVLRPEPRLSLTWRSSLRLSTLPLRQIHLSDYHPATRNLCAVIAAHRDPVRPAPVMSSRSEPQFAQIARCGISAPRRTRAPGTPGIGPPNRRRPVSPRSPFEMAIETARTALIARPC